MPRRIGPRTSQLLPWWQSADRCQPSYQNRSLLQVPKTIFVFLPVRSNRHQSDQIATRDFHEGGLWQERGSGQADAETPATGLAATADKQIAEMNRGKLRVFRGKLGVSAGLRGGRGLRRCVWRSLLRIGEDHLGPLSEPESLGRVKSGVCVPSSLERPPGSPAGPELPNPFVSGCALEVATFCARRLVPDRRPAQVRH